MPIEPLPAANLFGGFSITTMNDKLKIEGRRAVAGLLKMDKMQLIYWLLKAGQRDHWLLHSRDAQYHAPGMHLEAAKNLHDMMEDAGVDTDSAYHNFTRFCDKSWWVCSRCGLFTDHEETQTNAMHEKGCDGVCDYKVTACDFFDEPNDKAQATPTRSTANTQDCE